MDDNCGEWVECMGVVSRRWVWVESMGVYVASGCDCKDVYFLILFILTPLVSALFAVGSLLFVHKKNFFRSCSSTFL